MSTSILNSHCLSSAAFDEIFALMPDMAEAFVGFDQTKLETLKGRIDELLLEFPDSEILQIILKCLSSSAKYMKSDFTSALIELQSVQHLIINQEDSPISGMFESLLGINYRSIGELNLSLFHHINSNKILEESDTLFSIRTVNTYQIGEIYASMRDYEEAIKHFHQNLIAQQKQTAPSIFTFRSYSGLANVYISQNQFEKAKESIEKSNKYHNDNSIHKSKYLSDYARLYFSMQQYEKAIEYEEQSYNLRKEIGMIDACCTNKIMLGKSYIALNQLELAEENLTEALSLSESIQTKNKTLLAHEELADLYKIKGNMELAFYHLNSYVSLDKKMGADTEKQNYKIKHEQLILQKKATEFSLTELKASHSYAQRIQSAMLKSGNELKKLIAESYIFFKPHSKVSGDFYWFGETNGKIIIAAGDCTGHGVPAGMLTMKGHGLLSRIVMDMKITDPAEILTHLHEKIRYDLDYDVSKLEDGMDISICTIDKENCVIEYSGARRPLIIINDGELTKINGSSKSVGGGNRNKDCEFELHSHPLNLDATYYMFSDGFVDQFGGDNDKKFKSKAFFELLLSLENIPMENRSSKLDSTLMKWRGFGKKKITAQTDDILIIGFQINA